MQHLNTWLSDCNSWLRLFLQYSFDNKTDNFDDLPARFGYRLPSEGLKVSKLYDIDERHSILKNKIIYIYIYIYMSKLEVDRYGFFSCRCRYLEIRANI